jgi:DNA-binding YbaB/EbfC family protein
MKNISNMLKEAQKLQQRMVEMQQRLAETEMTGQAGGGLVTVVLNGKGEMKKVRIDKSLVDPNEVEILEDLIVAATNDAKAKIEAYVAAEMQKMTGGLPLPPGMKLPF